MLYEWQKNVEKYIPESVPGYDFASRVPVFIPIQEFGLLVWERKTQSLPLIYECVMSAVSCNSTSVSDISLQFGIPESVMLQIIAQLDTERLITVSAGNILLTEKGTQTLKAQKMVQTLRKPFNRIFINQITGEITDTPPVGSYREPLFRQPYLEEICPVSLDYLRSRFDDLSIVYKDSRIENVIFGTNRTESELYRILDITYTTLSYIMDYCFVYINQEDRSLSFKFQSGIRAYADAFQEQIKQQKNGAWRLLSQRHRSEETLCSLKDYILPGQLINAFNTAKGVGRYSEDVENAYYSSRTLMDGELRDILYNAHVFKPERILFEAKFLGDIELDAIINVISAQTVKEIIIHYDNMDTSASSIIQKMHEATSSRKGFQIKAIKKTGIKKILVYLGSQCTIEGEFCAIDTVYHRYIYKLCSRITFDAAENQRLWLENG